MTAEVPAVAALAEDEAVTASEGAAAIAAQSQYAVLTPGITEMNSVWEPVDGALQTIATGKPLRKLHYRKPQPKSSLQLLRPSNTSVAVEEEGLG